MSQVICTVILLIKYCQLVTVFNLLLYLLLLVITTAKCIIKDLRLTPLVHYKGQKGSRQSWVLSNKILKFPYQFSFQLKNFRYKRRPMDSSRPSTLEYNETSILLNDSRSIYLENSLQAKLVNGMNLQPLIDQCLMQIYYQGSNRNLNSHVTSQVTKCLSTKCIAFHDSSYQLDLRTYIYRDFNDLDQFISKTSTAKWASKSPNSAHLYSSISTKPNIKSLL